MPEVMKEFMVAKMVELRLEYEQKSNKLKERFAGRKGSRRKYLGSMKRKEGSKTVYWLSRKHMKRTYKTDFASLKERMDQLEQQQKFTIGALTHMQV